jgi:hypothetical protein
MNEIEFEKYKKEVSNNELIVNNFITKYCNFFKGSSKQIFLKPLSSHGYWDGKRCFGNELPSIDNKIEGKVAVLTRATIRLSKAKEFWDNVPIVNKSIQQAQGTYRKLWHRRSTLF